MDRESACSVRLSWLLDRIIGTEEQVTMRRKIDSIAWHTNNVHDRFKVIFSGSRGEGLLFTSSDTDLMYVLRNAIVLNSVNDIERTESSQKKMVLSMRREGCSPGFVLLERIPVECLINDFVAKSIVQYRDTTVVSSLIMRDEATLHCCGDNLRFEAHGPCSTTRIGPMDEDIAFCFACNTWPTEAYSFIHRRRLHGWPRKKLIDKIVQNGCHLVAIGNPNSEISHLQWRLSFSVSEKLLVHSFNHTQLKVYGLLKIFLKQAINTEESVKDLLCSYFLKTALFYSIETTPQSIWTEDLLISCFWFCFNKLITWVEEGNCPNYFVPENNMFRSKVYGERRQNLLRVLNLYKRLGWTCLCKCKDLKLLQSILKHPHISDECLWLDKDALSVSLDVTLFHKLISQNQGQTMNTQQGSRTFGRSLQLLSYSRSRDEADIASYMSCSAIKKIVKFCTSKLHTGNDAANNKSRYLLMKKCKNLLSISTTLDLSTRYLTDATFYYTVGNYKKSLQICEQMLLRWKPFVAYAGKEVSITPHAYVDFVRGQNLSDIDKVMKTLAHDVTVTKYDQAFFPKELHHDVHAASPLDLCIPPLPYMTFLVFLCHHNLGNIDISLSAVRDLRTLVDDEIQGGKYNHIVFNLLAICLRKLGGVSDAIEACVKSLQREPNRNGASKLLDELIREARW